MSAPFERRPMTKRAPKRNWKHGMLVNTKNPGNNTSQEVLALRLRSIQRITGEVFKVMAWLSEADRPTVRSWAELEIVTSDVFNNLIREGILQKDGSGIPRKLLDTFRQLKLTQLAYEKELLMTPAARALCLGKDGGGAPVDLVAHFAKTVTPDKDEADGEE
jgi:hypothetical protein